MPRLMPPCRGQTVLSCRGSWNCAPCPLLYVPFPRCGQDIPLGKRVAASGRGVYFCSMYLEIKVSDSTAGLTFGALKSGRVP